MRCLVASFPFRPNPAPSSQRHCDHTRTDRRQAGRAHAHSPGTHARHRRPTWPKAYRPWAKRSRRDFPPKHVLASTIARRHTDGIHRRTGQSARSHNEVRLDGMRAPLLPGSTSRVGFLSLSLSISLGSSRQAAGAPLLRNLSMSQSRLHAADAADAVDPSSTAASRLAESEAASKIQALARGQLSRQHQKDQRLWEAWNELDWASRRDRREWHSACTRLL